jgi:hypothetical protein
VALEPAMTIKALIEFFETFQNVPIEIEDVKDHCVQSLGVQDEIILHKLDMDPDILLGMLVRFTKRVGVYQEPKRCAIIIYNGSVSIEQQRLACCKELVHLFDVPALVTNTPESIGVLIDHLTKGLSITSLSPGDWHAMKDKMALHQALAILFPHEAREELLPAYEKAVIGDTWIAEHFCIPVEHVEFLMSDRWDGFRKALLEV